MTFPPRGSPSHLEHPDRQRHCGKSPPSSSGTNRALPLTLPPSGKRVHTRAAIMKRHVLRSDRMFERVKKKNKSQIRWERFINGDGGTGAFSSLLPRVK
ncbi:hypothetical protein C0J45_22599 [Silurus meridionalis]|nr:hypothetical protein C0J45_22599 [Silurus meridionalis]